VVARGARWRWLNSPLARARTCPTAKISGPTHQTFAGTPTLATPWMKSAKVMVGPAAKFQVCRASEMVLGHG
jgi:hypothetical protein